MIIKGYSEKLDANKIDNSDEINISLDNHILPKLTQEEREKVLILEAESVNTDLPTKKVPDGFNYELF